MLSHSSWTVSFLVKESLYSSCWFLSLNQLVPSTTGAVSIFFVCEIGKRRLHQLVEKEMVTYTIKQDICQESCFQ